jgi:transcriptional regulator with PAS, ATPase and Fis domain
VSESASSQPHLHLPHAARERSNEDLTEEYGDLTLARAIRLHVRTVLKLSSGPKQAAELLDVGRTTLYRWMKEWRMEGTR